MDETAKAIKIVFTDLDGTLYPGSHEEEPKEEKRGMARNMVAVHKLEAAGIPVIPATGNNVFIAQKKLLDVKTGEQLRNLVTTPGIYCNGALVKGAGGKEVDVRNLSAFLPKFLESWCSESSPAKGHGDICVCGLAKEMTLLLKWPGLTELGFQTGEEFAKCMMIVPGEYEWLEPDAFLAKADDVLSLPILTPEGSGKEVLLALQEKFQEHGLLHFDDAAGKLSNGEGDGVVCKHVTVPGLGPEIDISPVGVNKGSAIAKLLADVKSTLGLDCTSDGSEIAVFGDAGNDVELFGMRRARGGEALEPLGLGYRPVIRGAMPWASDHLLKEDSTCQEPVDVVLNRIIEAKGL